MKKVYACFFAILLFGCEKPSVKNGEQSEASPESKNEGRFRLLCGNGFEIKSA